MVFFLLAYKEENILEQILQNNNICKEVESENIECRKLIKKKYKTTFSGTGQIGYALKKTIQNVTEMNSMRKRNRINFVPSFLIILRSALTIVQRT